MKIPFKSAGNFGLENQAQSQGISRQTNRKKGYKHNRITKQG